MRGPQSPALRATWDGLRAWIRQHPVEGLVFAAAFVIVASSLHPTTGSGSNGNVEQWINLTNSMFYGKQDLLFSYGPLYWLTGGATSQYSVVTYWSVIVFVSGVNALLWALLAGSCHRARGYIFLAAAYFLFLGDLNQREALLLWPFALVVYLDFSRERARALSSGAVLALGLTTGLLFYVRFMYGLVSLATFATYLVYRSVVRRQLRELTGLLGSTLTGYVLVGLLVFHQPASLFRYVLINSQLNVGNSADMRLDVVENANVLWAALAAIMLLAVAVAARRRSLMLTVIVLLAIFVKIGFSRSDHYLQYFVTPTAVVAFALVLDRSRLGRTIFVCVLASLYFISSTGTYAGSPTRDALTAGTDLQRDYFTRVQEVYSAFVLDRDFVQRIGKATVDIYPYNNEYAFANRLNYFHRPLFQNYMTLTSTLDSMNERFFSSRGRPRFVLWTAGMSGCSGGACNPFDDFDQKYTLNEDPLTTSSILMNYHLVASTVSRSGAPVALLEANSQYTPYDTSELSRQTMRFGTWYQVPSGSGAFVKLRLEFRPTLYGRLKGLAFRGGIVKVRYRLATGQVVEYRLNALNASSGIVASPLLDRLDFTGPSVDAVQLVATTEGLWRPAFRGTWITVTGSLARARPVRLDPVAVLPTRAQPPLVACDGSVDSINGLTPLPVRVTTRGEIEVRGWLAASSAEGIPAEEPYLSLTGPGGTTLRISTRPEKRPDVAAAFGKPTLEDSGFTVAADLSQHPGRYELRLNGRMRGLAFSCSQYAVEVDVNSEAPGQSAPPSPR